MRVPGSALLSAAAVALALAVAPGTASADPACPDSDLQPTPANLVQVEAATLCLVNVQRAQHGLAALTANAVLQSAALEHSHDMVSNGFFSHDSSSGEDFADRILRFHYSPPNTRFVVGENIAWGTLSLSTPDSIVVSWMNSPSHRANVLNGKFKELGVGVDPSTPTGDPGGATYTADFGAHASKPVGVAKKPKSHKRVTKRHKRVTKRHRAKHRKHHKKHGGCSSTGSSAITLC